MAGILLRRLETRASPSRTRIGTGDGADAGADAGAGADTGAGAAPRGNEDAEEWDHEQQQRTWFNNATGQREVGRMRELGMSTCDHESGEARLRILIPIWVLRRWVYCEGKLRDGGWKWWREGGGKGGGGGAGEVQRADVDVERGVVGRFGNEERDVEKDRDSGDSREGFGEGREELVASSDKRKGECEARGDSGGRKGIGSQEALASEAASV